MSIEIMQNHCRALRSAIQKEIEQDYPDANPITYKCLALGELSYLAVVMATGTPQEKQYASKEVIRLIEKGAWNES